MLVHLMSSFDYSVYFLVSRLLADVQEVASHYETLLVSVKQLLPSLCTKLFAL